MLGHGPALPLALLEAAAPGYLIDQQWEDAGEDWLERALAYAAAPCRGVRGPLTRIRPRPGQPIPGQPCYRLADYLEQDGRAGRQAGSAPASLWDALLAHARQEDFLQLADEARSRGLYRYAFQLYAAAAEAGDTGGLVLAAGLLDETRRPEEAITIYCQAGEAGNPIALEVAAGLLAQAGRPEEAIIVYQQAAEAGVPHALEQAAGLLAKAGRAEEAGRLLRYGIEPGGRIADPWEARVQI
jgi:hypothetical protein